MFRKAYSSPHSSPRWASMTGAVLMCAALAGAPSRVAAHGISEASSETMAHGGILDYIWLGAEHMVTGYDHLLFLFGVIFFLTGFRDVVRFITAFTLGHCITLLGATLAGVQANAYLIDAVIALSVIYKGFENLDGFKKFFRIRAPNLLTMVFIFGLIHGFGLSTRLQELPLGTDGLISRILAFNVGVELGQVAALTVMLGFFKVWRASKTFARFSNMANVALVFSGIGLFAYQANGFVHERAHAKPHADEKADHEHDADHDDATHDDADHGHATHDDADHGHTQNTEPEPEALADPTPTDAEPIPDEPAIAEPAETEHEHGHSHGHGHTHKSDKKAAEEPAEAPVKAKKEHGHSHGSGDKHTH